MGRKKQPFRLRRRSKQVTGPLPPILWEDQSEEVQVKESGGGVDDDLGEEVVLSDDAYGSGYG